MLVLLNVSAGSSIVNSMKILPVALCMASNLKRHTSLNLTIVECNRDHAGTRIHLVSSQGFQQKREICNYTYNMWSDGSAVIKLHKVSYCQSKTCQWQAKRHRPWQTGVMGDDCFMSGHTHNHRDSHGWKEMHGSVYVCERILRYTLSHLYIGL